MVGNALSTGSAFLSAFQPAFIADCVHHDLSFGSQVVGDHNEQAKDDGKEQGFENPTAFVKLQTAEAEGSYKEGRQKKDNPRIAETVERFEELHHRLPLLRSVSSMPPDTCGNKEKHKLTMSDIHIRPASVQDAAQMARLDNVASHGLAEWFWKKQARNDGRESADWMALSAAEMAKTDYPPGWSNTEIAEMNGQIVGAASGCLTQDNGEAIGILPEPVFAPVFELFQVAAGDWLLDWLAVEPAAQGQGVGGKLLDNCLERARTSGAVQASLVVEDSNETALALYHSRGFRQRDQRPYIPFNTISRTQNWLLLSAPVT